MTYLILLAGGVGSRMNTTSGIPKQFLYLEKNPIIIETLQRIINYSVVDIIVIVCHNDYIDYLTNLLENYSLEEKVYVTSGGQSRLDSTLSGCNFITQNFKTTKDDIFLAHDSVRPFVSKKILVENILKCKQYGTATTVFPVMETILKTDEDDNIVKVYARDHLFSGQSPQTFNLIDFLELSKKIPCTHSQRFTDLSEVYYYFDLPVMTVLGDRKNIKITTEIDLKIAKELLDDKVNI